MSDTLGWHFDNSYVQLPNHFYSRVPPIAVKQPNIVVFNHELGNELGLKLDSTPLSLPDALIQMLSGNTLPESTDPIAQAYAGHQFGHFTMLGDGRAHLLGEHITPSQQRVDIQLKGSGPTPYSRGGDGRATLSSMLREYIISEAMHALEIATTRSLAVITTGESVQREIDLPGAILTRISSSHIRVGTFQFAAAQQEVGSLKRLADYTLNRHYPELTDAHSPYLALLQAVMERQIKLIVHWLRVGFIHGVMNTDNMTVCGETIDYGPCAFMDHYDPNTVFSAIDQMGRYAYGNQPQIALWNLTRFAGTLLPLIHDNLDAAAEEAESILNTFHSQFETAWLNMMRGKLGLLNQHTTDIELIQSLLALMQQHQADYTQTFHQLSISLNNTLTDNPASDNLADNHLFHSDSFAQWHSQWLARVKQTSDLQANALTSMQTHNPVIIPRNHQVAAALTAAEEANDYKLLHTLLEAIRQPYQERQDYISYQQAPKPQERVFRTFCGT